MKKQITEAQRKKLAADKQIIRNAFRNEEFSHEKHFNYLVAQGYSKEYCEKIIKGEEALFQKSKKNINSFYDDFDFETAKFIVGLLAFVAGVIVYFDLLTLPFQIGSALIGGFLGYFIYPSKGIATSVAGFIFMILLPYAMDIYLDGRNRFIVIELIIPIIIAGLPAMIVASIGIGIYSLLKK